MLRAGLTGGLGSGKSTVGEMLRRRGAHVLHADEIAREMMAPGEAVYAAIVERFGRAVVRPDGELDRGMLARMAFEEGRVEELNAIVHPAVIASQAARAEEIGRRDGGAVVVVESALIFETRYAGERGWRERFDRLLLVTASDATKVERYVARCAGGRVPGTSERSEMEAEARRRLSRQMPDEMKIAQADFVLTNDGSIAGLERQVDVVWERLRAEAEEGRDR